MQQASYLSPLGHLNTPRTWQESSFTNPSYLQRATTTGSYLTSSRRLYSETRHGIEAPADHRDPHTYMEPSGHRTDCQANFSILPNKKEEENRKFWRYQRGRFDFAHGASWAFACLCYSMALG
jgi:hypothetical protein